MNKDPDGKCIIQSEVSYLRPIVSATRDCESDNLMTESPLTLQKKAFSPFGNFSSSVVGSQNPTSAGKDPLGNGGIRKQILLRGAV